MSCLRLRCMLSIISLLSFEEGTLDDQLSDRLVTLYIICILYIFLYILYPSIQSVTKSVLGLSRFFCQCLR
jgi:hypothetical protein